MFLNGVKNTGNLEIAIVKKINEYRIISSYIASIMLLLIIFLTTGEPTFLIQLLNGLLWLLSGGIIMPETWLGGESNIPAPTLLGIIKLTTEDGNGWVGELKQGGNAIGVIAFSALSMIMIPILRKGLSTIIRDNHKIISATYAIIKENPYKFATEEQLYKKVKEFILIHFKHLGRSASGRRRRERIITQIVIELGEKPRQLAEEHKISN